MNNLPTQIYCVTGVRSKPWLFGNTGPLKLTLRGRLPNRGIRVWKRDPFGWLDVTREFLTEEGYKAW